MACSKLQNEKKHVEGANQLPARPLSISLHGEKHHGLDELQRSFRAEETWTPEELKQLKENFDRFVEVHKIKDGIGFLFGNDRKTRHTKKLLGFNEYICQGLAAKRNIHYGSNAVNRLKYYYLVRKRVKFSQKETRELLSLQKSCKNRWTEIARAMGRCRNALFVRYHMLKGESKWKEKYRTERWSTEEINAFNKAMKSYFIDKKRAKKSEKRLQRKGINWRLIAESVGRRSIRQCKSRYNLGYNSEKSGNEFKLGK